MRNILFAPNKLLLLVLLYSLTLFAQDSEKNELAPTSSNNISIIVNELPDKAEKENSSFRTIEDKVPRGDTDLRDESTPKVSNSPFWQGSLLLIISLGIFIFIIWLIKQKYRLVVIKWLLLVASNCFLLAVLAGGIGNYDGFIETIEYGKRISGMDCLFLALIFSINIPVFLKKWLTKLASLNEFKITNIKLDLMTLSLLGILLLLIYFLKKLFLPVTGIFIVILSIYIFIFKKINKKGNIS